MLEYKGSKQTQGINQRTIHIYYDENYMQPEPYDVAFRIFQNEIIEPDPNGIYCLNGICVEGISLYEAMEEVVDKNTIENFENGDIICITYPNGNTEEKQFAVLFDDEVFYTQSTDDNNNMILTPHNLKDVEVELIF